MLKKEIGSLSAEKDIAVTMKDKYEQKFLKEM